MFQREPRKWRTQEISLAPLFQPHDGQDEIEFKSFVPFQRNREIVTYKKQVLKKVN